MRIRNLVLSGVVAALIAACAQGSPEDVGVTKQAVLSNGLHTSVVRLRSPTSPGEKYDPVVLSRGKDGTWSTVFHLVCNDCTSSLNAFGYAPDFVFDWAPKYESVDELRGGEELPEAIEIVDLPATPNQIISAFRVVDADPAAPERQYFVRLAANPKKIYAVSCDNFLNTFQGNTTTIPVNKAVLEAWGKTFDLKGEIGCNSRLGKAFPTPAAAPDVEHPIRDGQPIAVWNVKYALPNAKSDQLPYVVTRGSAGVRSYAIDCGSEALNALSALGFTPNDVKAHANDAEFQATRPAEQPILRCTRSATAPISAFHATNEVPSGVRFKMDDKPFLVEFGCDKARDYWSQRALTTTDVPAQALPYVGLNAALTDPIAIHQTTKLAQVGCKVPIVTHFGREWIAHETTEAGAWCTKPSEEILTGDFNGDGRTDLLCHDKTGSYAVQHASSAGTFSGTASWEKSWHWCHHAEGQLLAGDFNGDRHTDILCRDRESGNNWIAYAMPNGGGFSYGWEGGSAPTGGTPRGDLYAGDFTGDGKADVLTHDKAKSEMRFHVASKDGRIEGIASGILSVGWCSHVGSRLLAGEFNSDRVSDLFCHDKGWSRLWAQYGSGNWVDNRTTWEGVSDWCSASSDKLFVGDFDADGNGDLYCNHRGKASHSILYGLKNTP